VGSSAQFTVTASGGALTYQWYKDGVAIAGATSAGYTVPDINQAGATGAYTVKVTNAAGSITSTPAALTLIAPPVFTAQPASVARHVGQSAAFAVSVTSAAPISYQWYKDGLAIAGATQGTYALGSVGVNDGGVYKVVVSNAAASYSSSEATLSLAPTILSQPTSFYGPAKTKSLLPVSTFTFDSSLQGWVAEPGVNDVGSLTWSNSNSRSKRTYVSGKSSAGWYGQYGEQQSGRSRGFIYDGATFTPIDFPAQLHTWVSAVTSTGLVVGKYGSSGEYGFTMRDGVYTPFAVPGNAWIEGAYRDVYGVLNDGTLKGFIYENGVVTKISYPGAYSTRLKAVSDGKFVGSFTTSSTGVEQAFYYDGATYKIIAVPGSQRTYLTAVGQGKIAGTYYDSAWNSHGFVYDGVTYVTVDPPGQTADNFITGIFDGGVVGTYFDQPSGFDSQTFSFESSGSTTRVIAVPIAPSQYAFRGLQCDNLSGRGASASIKSPAISLSGASSAVCAVRLRLLGASPGDLVIEASSDQVSWESVFVSTGLFLQLSQI